MKRCSKNLATESIPIGPGIGQMQVPRLIYLVGWRDLDGLRRSLRMRNVCIRQLHEQCTHASRRYHGPVEVQTSVPRCRHRTTISRCDRTITVQIDSSTIAPLFAVSPHNELRSMRRQELRLIDQVVWGGAPATVALTRFMCRTRRSSAG